MLADGPTVQDLLDQERTEVPPALRDTRSVALGTDPIPTSRYTDPAFAVQELERVWGRVWQMACREEDIPRVGDFEVYEIGHLSFLVVRVTPGEIRAYRNVCLHRGRILKEEGGNAQFFRCPFHGFSWNLDGSCRSITNAWDFEHVDPKEFCLPQAQVGTWGGFVFLNPDLDAEPLESYLDDLPEIFRTRGWDLSQRTKTVWVRKRNRCNWKVALEAFIESFHVVATHPSAMPWLGDAYSQYDIWPDRRHFTRMISPRGLPSPHLGRPMTESEVFAAGAAGMTGVEDGLPEGLTARQAMGDLKRQALARDLGIDTEGLTDCEVLDTIQYHVFPNLVFWTGWGSFLVYRFRPEATDPETSIMEVFFLTPHGGDRALETVRKPTCIDYEESYTRAPELGRYGDVFDEDLSNMPYVQRGLHAFEGEGLNLANYEEARIRYFHQLLDRYLADPDA